MIKQLGRNNAYRLDKMTKNTQCYEVFYKNLKLFKYCMYCLNRILPDICLHEREKEQKKGEGERETERKREIDVSCPIFKIKNSEVISLQ